MQLVAQNPCVWHIKLSVPVNNSIFICRETRLKSCSSGYNCAKLAMVILVVHP